MAEAADKKAQNNKPRTAIVPTREENFPEWYQEVIKVADLAENSPVRGCYTLKPYGYALWENLQRYLDNLIREENVQNAYFPLLIPLSYIAKEAEHIDGFAKECAVVTHHRLEADGKGGLKPSGELTEPFVIRPTSETIIGESMSKWITSYRDLPLKLNQWANVMRWEMRPRVFLRTAEFLWQEGHNAFATQQDAEKDAYRMLEVYQDVAENLAAVPVIPGQKTADERFPGAVDTLTIEAIMQDGKALQYATSHYLGTTFAKSFNVNYQDKEGNQTLCHTTSWGMSTRTIGGLIMVHSDDDGLRLPPNIAPHQVVILPITKNNEGDDAILKYCAELTAELKKAGVRVKFDDRDIRSGDKMWDSIKKGVPLRVEVGGKEVEEGKVTSTRRDLGRDSKQTLSKADFVKGVKDVLADIQKTLFEQAKAVQQGFIKDCKTLDEAKSYFQNTTPAGLVRMDVSVLEDAGFEALKKEFSLSTRCMPLADKGKKVLIGRSY